MQPCMTCGSTTVNAIGNCTGCGTFRGAEMGQPGYGAPPPGYPQQPQGYGPAQPYQQPQYDQYDQYAQPQLGPPQYQQQYPPQQYAPPPQYSPQQFAPPQQRRSNSGLVVGILVGVLVLLLGGGTAIAVVAYNNRDDPTTPSGPTRSAGAASAATDNCVVGTWRETASNYTMTVDSVQVNMTASGAIQHFKADGSGDLDMSATVLATGTAGGKKYERSITGKINFKYHVQDNKIYYTDVTATGSSTVKVDNVAGSPNPLQGSTDPDTYTCSGDTFVQSGASYRIQLQRQ